MKIVSLLVGVLAMAFIATTPASAQGSASGSPPTRIQPGETGTTPDGAKLENTGTTGDITIVYKYVDGQIVSWTTTFPAKGKGKIDGSGNKKKVGDNKKGKLEVHGDVKLEDVGGADVEIAKDGKADCENCDNNNFDDQGELTGPGGGNDNNDIHLNGGTSKDFRGNGNNYH